MAIYLNGVKYSDVAIKFEGATISSDVTLQTKTATPTKSAQNITADDGFTGLEKVTVNPIPAAYITTTDADATVTDIKSGKTAYVNGAKITGTYVPDTGLDTSDATATATDIILNKTAYVNGSKVTGSREASSSDDYSNSTIGWDGANRGATYVEADVTKNVYIDSGSKARIYLGTSDYFGSSTQDKVLNNATFTSSNGVKLSGTMPNNGAISSEITTQGGTATIPAGYTTGGTVTANIAASAIDNNIINGATNINQTGDTIDTFTVTVNVPEGYHSGQILTKEFENILPEIETDATNAYILNGYQAYGDDGTLLTGTMTNNGSITQTLDGTTTSYTIPEGYHDGTGTVSHSTVTIANPVISVSSSGLIEASRDWTPGYTKNSGIYAYQQLPTKGTTKITPSTESQTAISSGTYATGNITVDPIPSNYITTADADATETDIISGKTAYVNGSKIAGSRVQGIPENGLYFDFYSITQNGVISFSARDDIYLNSGNICIFTIDKHYFGTATPDKVLSGYNYTGPDGVNINGTLVVQHYYTSTSAPDSSLGEDGDICLVG